MKMKAPRMQFTNLDEASLSRIQAMEEQFGALILAVEPKYPLADLTAEQLARLQALEKELGVVLMAYKTFKRS